MNIKLALPLICGSVLAVAGCSQESKAPTTSASDTKTASSSPAASSSSPSSSSPSIKDQAIETLKLDREDSTNIKVGDCFNEPTASDMTKDANQGDLIASVPMRKCTEPHDNEVFASFKLADSAILPTDQQVQEAVDKNCSAPFMQYVGKDINKSKYDVAFMSPSEQTWKQGDREVTCYVTAKPGQKLTKSVKGTKL